MSDDQLLHDLEQPPARGSAPIGTGAAGPTPADAVVGALAAKLAQRISDSLLPADSPLSPVELAAAAGFLLESAQGRRATETALAIGTVSGAAGSRFMRIAVINEDMPFLVDSIAATIAAHELEIQRLIHPVINVVRDAAGRIIDFPENVGFDENSRATGDAEPGASASGRP